MAVIKIMQGDSYVVFIQLTVDQQTLTPEMVEDVEICVGEALRKTCSGGGVGFDSSSQMWYIRPTQTETLAMAADVYEVVARVKFCDGDSSDVIGIRVGRIMIQDGKSEEVI